jgi:glycosyltransferase involved in cell wall biosynthesis
MEVLHLAYSGLGGTASVVFSLIEGDKKKILNNSILFTGPEINSDYKIKSIRLGIKFNYVRTIKYFYPIFFLSIIKKIIHCKPKIIFLHNYLIFECLFYKIFFPGTKIIYINHTPINNFTWRDRLIISLSLFINRIVTLNKKTYIFFKKKNKSNLSKVVLIPNGINTNFFSKLNTTKKSYYKIGMACRMNKNKKYNLIIDSLLSKEIKDLNIKFSIAGTGNDFYNIKNKIKRLELKDKIKLEGYLNEVKLKKWFESLDLYVQASSGEGMSTSLLQAMSMKIPVIGSNVTGIKDFLEKKKYLGRLFENNTTDLSKKIKYFYFLNIKTRNKFIKRQYNYIIKNHNCKKMFLDYFSKCKITIN